MTCVAIIPARGGSKRIPRKNIKFFAGKPIIGYSVEVALQSQLFDRVIVSTDDQEIAGVTPGRIRPQPVDQRLRGGGARRVAVALAIASVGITDIVAI